ncbi:hypothetical protein DL96DRAFT_1816316 [Flagelloscypha sp. PMI_526]|nr:hypothetical protein DL96DRAFT_1816316 [Flagelloscypha sp. PMI_526]
MAVSALVARWESGRASSPTQLSLSSATDSRSPSPPTPDEDERKGSLIDLRDWVVELGSADSPKSNPAPLIHLETSTKKPPLPPRKPSLSSLKAAAAKQLQQQQHSYPPRPAKLDLPPKSPGHAPGSSISSFHSISLSSDGGGPSTPNSTQPDFTGTSEGSLDESFEKVSNTSYGSPVHGSTPPLPTREKPALPPRLPQRPSQPQSVVPPTTPKAYSRRAPPAPPSRVPSNSDRSSMLSFRSNASTTSGASSAASSSSSAFTSKYAALSRPTPVPSAARKRYEDVFVANVIGRRKARSGAKHKNNADDDVDDLIPHSPKESKARRSRQAAGWRGLSVDLIGVDSGGFEEVVDEQVGPEERLSGRIIKQIWLRSRLDRAKLREIWLECDSKDEGSLDRDRFIQGMWRIDEELRKIHLRAPGSAGIRGSTAFTGTGSLKIKSPVVLPKPKPKPKPILN